MTDKKIETAKRIAELKFLTQSKASEKRKLKQDAADFFKSFFAAYDKIVGLAYHNDKGVIFERWSTRKMHGFHSAKTGGLKFLRENTTDYQIVRICSEMGLAVEDLNNSPFNKTFAEQWALHRQHCPRDGAFAEVCKTAAAEAKLKKHEEFEKSLALAIYVDLSNILCKLRIQKQDVRHGWFCWSRR